MTDRVAIAGGTLVSMREINVTPTVATLSIIPEVEMIGDISESNAEIQATPLSSKNVRYISGLTDGQPLEITMFLLTDDAVQKRLGQAVRNRTDLEILVQPDDTAIQWRFNYRANGQSIRTGNAGDPKRRVIQGRVNGPVTFEANARTTS